MKLLHTSDWHLGRSLHGVDLTAAQDGFLAVLVGVVVEHAVDCVVVSGDVFDRAIPPVEALRSYERALGQLASHATVIVAGGNHDSPARLGFAGSLLRSGIHVCTDPAAVGAPVTLTDEFGEVLIYPIPYLDPDHARHVLADNDEPLERSHQAVMAAATRRIAADLELRRAADGSRARTVIVAHAFVAGGSSSESERDIQVGGVASISRDLFADFDYVALGHLHRRQGVATEGRAVLSYAGSPLRYSFDESGDQKSLTLVRLSGVGVETVEQVSIPQPRPMATLTDGIDALLDPEVVRRHRDSWLRIVVTDDARPDRLFERVRAQYPHALVIRHSPASRAAVLCSAGISERSNPIDVTTRFVTEVTASAPSWGESIALADAVSVVASQPRG